MSEASPLPRGSTPTVPQKRPFVLEDEQHAPTVSSPLNPDSANARTRKQPAREQREKKESLRKREAKGVEGTRHATPDAQSQRKKSQKSASAASILSPIRYKLAPPKSTDFDPPRAPVLTPTYRRAQRQFYESSEQYEHRFPFGGLYIDSPEIASTTAKVSAISIALLIRHFRPLNTTAGRKPSPMGLASTLRMHHPISSSILQVRVSPRKRDFGWLERTWVFERADGIGNAKS
jgi:hypothetical protein